MRSKRLLLLIFFLGLALDLAAAPAPSDRVPLPGLVPRAKTAVQPVPVGKLAGTNRIYLAIGLPLRNEPELKQLLHDLYSPGHKNFHKFLTPQEFADRFGPTPQDYEAVARFAEENGLAVVGRHSNRLVLDVEGETAAVERAFQVKLQLFKHPSEARNFYAPDREPSVPARVPIADVWGLSDLLRPKPLARPLQATAAIPLNFNGTGPSGSYKGRDFRNAYSPGTPLIGSGQVAAVAEFDGYYTADITGYESSCGYTNVPLQNVLVNGVTGLPGYSGVPNAVVEVSLDIELMIAMAPGLSQLMVYEGSNPYDVFNRIVTDNSAKQISCSWAWNAGPTDVWGHPGNKTLDSQLQQMAAQGQSFFQASGDSDAYTGSQALSASSGPIPVDSIYVTSVGGTSLSMNGAGASWASETVWNWGNNTGSSGGISSNYTRPYWQTNVSMSANNGSTLYRNIPDVAMTADAVYVVYDNGSTGIFGGTSCAAPLWAGFTALVNQQALAESGAPAGFLNPALYSIANSSSYNACFHDITTGNNIGNNTPGLFVAVADYDLATGLGTPNGTNLINALAPLSSPYFVAQPASQIVNNGTQVMFSGSAGGQAPLYYRWLFDGTNLAVGANFSGLSSNVLTITSASVTNSGNYQLVVTNTAGSVTSAVATLTVRFPPSFSTQPTNQTIAVGGNAGFSATVSGGTPLNYQWRQNGNNLANGGNISGASSTTLALTGVALTNGGNYVLVASNSFGAATSSVAILTVVQPATITAPPTAQLVQCGSDALFTVSAVGTPPPGVQWTLDGTPVPGATTTALQVSNVHFPNHNVSVTVSNQYGSSTASAALTVQDTLAPAVTLNGAALINVELGATFTDPGASAYDSCAGAVAVSVSGTVNTGTAGTNILTYSANDGNGNTNSASRTVIVRDTTPPSIQWSFTNLVLVANSNCSAVLPDLTGTNYILADDLSTPLTVVQAPTNGALLSVGLTTVVLSVVDSQGNTAYSTNSVLVQDQTPPSITLNGASLTYLELGNAFADPGTIAADNCAGVVSVVVAGTVQTNAVGTNILVYTASDGNGNSNTVSRTVVVQDTTLPAIQWSFTNLVLATSSNCSAVLPDLTGTNYILATDFSTPLTISQTPTNGTVLSVGVTAVVLSVTDSQGNTAFSTNAVLVQDLTPPVITLNGTNPIYVELGAAFLDPGATATDLCAGILPVGVNGTVNTNAVGTNVLLYSASDGSGNSNTVSRTVVVRDTTPPVIQSSFTNLLLTADSNCSAVLPDLTGTNYILATDLSAPLMIAQTPTNGTALSPGLTTVVLSVIDPYGNTAYSTNTVLVQDLAPPTITLNGANPLYVQLGSTFSDPGANAMDACAGTVPVSIDGTVYTNAVGTNVLLYAATDGNGNSNTVSRTVIVRDTTPPTIQRSFTNLVLTAASNCSAVLPDLTGTNDILATDVSEPLTITQNPTNGSLLSLGLHTVVVTVTDAQGNSAFSTNSVLVADLSPPLITAQPQSQTNLVGTTANFEVSATACTAVSCQWYFDDAPLPGRTASTLNLTNLAVTQAGRYAVVCTSSGGAATSAVAILTVERRLSSVALLSSMNPSGFKDSLNFTATITPSNATGSVEFFTNGVSFDLQPLPATSNSIVTPSAANLPRGTNWITAVYSGDANDAPATNTLAQIVTNHPPEASDVFLARAPGATLEIALTNLASGWSDQDGDTVAFAGTTPSTNGVSLIVNAGTLVYSNSNDVPDQFGCAITDGWAGTNQQTVHISVLTAAILSITANPDTSLSLALQGTPGYAYALLSTTNLAVPAWAPLATNVLGTNGLWQFTDSAVTNSPQRFYRLKYQP